MAIKTKVLKKKGRKLARAGAASLQSGAATTARAARSTVTKARVAAGAAGALAVMGAGLAARKIPNQQATPPVSSSRLRLQIFGLGKFGTQLAAT